MNDERASEPGSFKRAAKYVQVVNEAEHEKKERPRGSYTGVQNSLVKEDTMKRFFIAATLAISPLALATPAQAAGHGSASASCEAGFVVNLSGFTSPPKGKVNTVKITVSDDVVVNGTFDTAFSGVYPFPHDDLYHGYEVIAKAWDQPYPSYQYASFEFGNVGPCMAPASKSKPKVEKPAASTAAKDGAAGPHVVPVAARVPEVDKIIAKPVTFIDPACGDTKASIVKERHPKGYKYDVDRKGNKATVTARALKGYELANTTRWTHTFKEPRSDCRAQVVAIEDDSQPPLKGKVIPVAVGALVLAGVVLAGRKAAKK